MYKIYQIKLHDKGYSVDSNITEQANIVKTIILTSNSALVLNLSLLAEKDFNFAVTDNMC